MTVSSGGSAGWPGGRPGLLAFLPRFLFTDAGGWWSYVLLAWPVVVLPALALGWLTATLAPELPGPELDSGSDAQLAIGIVLLSPFIETLLMSGLVAMLRGMLRPALVVIGSAVLWAGLHSLVAAAWGLIVWWPFLIFSIAYLTWRPFGYWRAVGLVTLLHALNNLLPTIVLLVFD